MSIHQEIQINVSVSQVFGALTRSAVFSQISGGAPAEIDARNGGAFSCFGGMITGRNIELDENRLIVQAWRAGNWPPGTYSLVNFAFRKLMEARPALSSHSTVIRRKSKAT